MRISGVTTQDIQSAAEHANMRVTNTLLEVDGQFVVNLETNAVTNSIDSRRTTNIHSTKIFLDYIYRVSPKAVVAHTLVYQGWISYHKTCEAMLEPHNIKDKYIRGVLEEFVTILTGEKAVIGSNPGEYHIDYVFGGQYRLVREPLEEGQPQVYPLGPALVNRNTMYYMLVAAKNALKQWVE